jgi:hypothetical protein
MLTACGATTLEVQQGTTVMPAPLVSPSTTIPAVTTAAWTPVVAAQYQAAQVEGAEEQYATCFTYAGLDQGLVGNTPGANTPLIQSCPTYGLTPAVAQEIQGLIMETT